MAGAFQGTFVLSWSDTVTDGVPGAPPSALRVGSLWSWSGQPVRVDGPRDVLQLGLAEGEAELRARAALRARKILGAHPGLVDPESGLDTGSTDSSLTLTDGHETYQIGLVTVPGGAKTMAVFYNGFPPRERDLWVVQLILPRLREQRRGSGVICFAPGTMINAEGGPRAIETLRPGDKIETRDNGLEDVIWTGARRITGARMHVMPHLRPVRVRQSALGLGEPQDDLLVSADHRLLVRGDAARALFNTDEVLVAAKDLLNGRSVHVDLTLREITYCHLMTERHEVIWANGLATESFHPAHMDLDLLTSEARAALADVCPDPSQYGAYARRSLSGHEAALLPQQVA